MYTTLKPTTDGEYSGRCPSCGVEVRVGADLVVAAKCSHFVRRWRVSADQRVRAEFRREPVGA